MPTDQNDNDLLLQVSTNSQRFNAETKLIKADINQSQQHIEHMGRIVASISGSVANAQGPSSAHIAAWCATSQVCIGRSWYVESGDGVPEVGAVRREQVYGLWGHVWICYCYIPKYTSSTGHAKNNLCSFKRDNIRQTLIPPVQVKIMNAWETTIPQLLPMHMYLR